ncbi:CvpA family protein [bacterium]|nr:CvpA family protein [bacterium]
MTVVDFVVLFLLALFLIRGLMRGFLVEIFLVLGFIGGYFAAKAFGPKASVYLSTTTDMADWMTVIIGTVGIFLITTIAIRLLGIIIKKMLKAFGLGPIDRFLGAFAGLAKGAMVVIILMIIALMSPWEHEARARGRRGVIAPYVFLGADVFLDQVANGILKSTQRIIYTDSSYREKMMQMFADKGMDPKMAEVLADNPEIIQKLYKRLKEADFSIPITSIMDYDISQVKQQWTALHPRVKKDILTSFKNDTIMDYEPFRKLHSKLEREADKAIKELRKL